MQEQLEVSHRQPRRAEGLELLSLPYHCTNRHADKPQGYYDHEVQYPCNEKSRNPAEPQPEEKAELPHGVNPADKENDDADDGQFSALPARLLCERLVFGKLADKP